MPEGLERGLKIVRQYIARQPTATIGGMVTSSGGEWEVWCDGSQFAAHTLEPSFASLLTLARIVNNLRYHHVATLAVIGDDSPSAVRQRTTSFLNVAGTLYEALLFSERLGRHFRELSAFKDLQQVLADPTVRSFRDGALKRLRHQVVYHHDEAAIAEALDAMRDSDRYVFANGTTFRKADVYYVLADLAALYYAVPQSGDDRSFADRLRDLFEKAASLAIRFGNAADTLIAAQLKTSGWRTGRTA